MNWQTPATGKRGRQPTFSDTAIPFCLTLKCLSGLALRQATGVVESRLRLAGIDWTVPDFSTLSRRQKDLQVFLVQKKQCCLHLGIDAQTLEIRAMEVTDNRTGDAPILPDLLSQIPEAEELATVTGDGAYDTRLCHAAIAERGTAAITPPRRNGQFWKGNSRGNQACNESLRSVKYLGRML